MHIYILYDAYMYLVMHCVCHLKVEFFANEENVCDINQKYELYYTHTQKKLLY